MAGNDVGLMSEAGCPGIADPGADIVAEAHRKGIKVVPLVGPSSILLALMASGFNGQSFTFHGYIPIDKLERAKKIKELEGLAEKKQTQIFIETPFRNDSMLEDVLKHCKPQTRLCIACDITASTEFIKTMSIADWKKQVPDLRKRPAIFYCSTPDKMIALPQHTQVLIVGAGPSGLMMAAQLLRYGVVPVIIDTRQGPTAQDEGIGGTGPLDGDLPANGPIPARL
jgi:16S rRNA C1402 (ribose-2'-O) methylase RsmI